MTLFLAEHVSTELRLFDGNVSLKPGCLSDFNQGFFFPVSRRPVFKSYVIMYMHTNSHAHISSCQRAVLGPDR